MPPIREKIGGSPTRNQSGAPHVGANWVNPHLGVNLGCPIWDPIWEPIWITPIRGPIWRTHIRMPIIGTPSGSQSSGPIRGTLPVSQTGAPIWKPIWGSHPGVNLGNHHLVPQMVVQNLFFSWREVHSSTGRLVTGRARLGGWLGAENEIKHNSPNF